MGGKLSKCMYSNFSPGKIMCIAEVKHSRAIQKINPLYSMMQYSSTVAVTKLVVFEIHEKSSTLKVNFYYIFFSLFETTV